MPPRRKPRAPPFHEAVIDRSALVRVVDGEAGYMAQLPRDPDLPEDRGLWADLDPGAWPDGYIRARLTDCGVSRASWNAASPAVRRNAKGWIADLLGLEHAIRDAVKGPLAAQAADFLDAFSKWSDKQGKSKSGYLWRMRRDVDRDLLGDLPWRVVDQFSDTARQARQGRRNLLLDSSWCAERAEAVNQVFADCPLEPARPCTARDIAQIRQLKGRGAALLYLRDAFPMLSPDEWRRAAPRPPRSG